MPICFLEFLRSFLSKEVISTPSMIILPLVGSSNLFRQRIKVDFPAPLNPIIPNISPFFYM